MTSFNNPKFAAWVYGKGFKLPFLSEQRTATSLEWLQVVLFWTQPIRTWRLHEKRLFSLDTQVRLLIHIGPVPSPKAALVKEVTAVVTHNLIHCKKNWSNSTYRLRCLKIQIANMPLLHHWYPIRSHKLYPTCCCCRPPLALPSH